MLRAAHTSVHCRGHGYRKWGFGCSVMLIICPEIVGTYIFIFIALWVIGKDEAKYLETWGLYCDVAQGQNLKLPKFKF